MAELVVQLAEHDKVVRGEREHWFSKQGLANMRGLRFGPGVGAPGRTLPENGARVISGKGDFTFCVYI